MSYECTFHYDCKGKWDFLRTETTCLLWTKVKFRYAVVYSHLQSISKPHIAPTFLSCLGWVSFCDNLAVEATVLSCRLLNLLGSGFQRQFCEMCWSPFLSYLASFNRILVYDTKSTRSTSTSMYLYVLVLRVSGTPAISQNTCYLSFTVYARKQHISMTSIWRQSVSSQNCLHVTTCTSLTILQTSCYC